LRRHCWIHRKIGQVHFILKGDLRNSDADKQIKFFSETRKRTKNMQNARWRF
jgi:hypothetical protein